MTLLVAAGLLLPLVYEPTASYEVRNVEGWTVRVSNVLVRDHPAIAAQVEQLLRVNLFEVTRVVPRPALEKIRGVTIWLEYQDRDIVGGVYHPSANWLRTHGFNPEKAGAVEVGHARNYLRWSLGQPWMVFHELAHAYHDQVIGTDNAEVLAAYKEAVESHRYDKVLYIYGGERRHYALSNPKEYFAESSEAFFGTNDFYPFVREELRQFDPTMYGLLKKFWGVE